MWLRLGGDLAQRISYEISCGLTKRARDCAQDGDNNRYPTFNDLRVNTFCTHNVMYLRCKYTIFLKYANFFGRGWGCVGVCGGRRPRVGGRARERRAAGGGPHKGGGTEARRDARAQATTGPRRRGGPRTAEHGGPHKPRDRRPRRARRGALRGACRRPPAAAGRTW